MSAATTICRRCSPGLSSSTAHVRAIDASRVYATVRSPYGRPAVTLVAARSVVRLQRVGVPLVERVVAPTDVTLPVRRGQRLGDVRVYERGRLVARAPLHSGALDPEARRARPRSLVRDTYAPSSGHARLLRRPSVIVTVTLNAALDRSVTVPIFQLGHRHRASDVLVLAGGKGINVARALKHLDVPVVATGLAGGRTGTRIVEELTAEAILNDFVRIGDESRTSTAVLDPTSGTYTEINEWGPKVTEAELEILLEKLHYLSRGADMVVVAGSLPRGVADGFYAELVRELARGGVRVVLDTEGEPLRLGLEAEPWLVSPNQREAEQLVGQELEDDDDFLMALDTIAEMGARNVHITLETGASRSSGRSGR